MSASRSSERAPTRSILLMKISVGSRNARSVFISARVCGCTPSTADITSTAPSSTPSARSTSATKSLCPGVSMRLTWRSPTGNAATAERMVIPRRRSMSPVSVCVVPESTLPRRSITPVSNSRRSVRLVLPASTCARIPMLTVCIGWLVLESSHPQGQRVSESSHRRSPVVGCRRDQADRASAGSRANYRGRRGRQSVRQPERLDQSSAISISTLPTAPCSTAAWASPGRSSGKW